MSDQQPPPPPGGASEPRDPAVPPEEPGQPHPGPGFEPAAPDGPAGPAPSNPPGPGSSAVRSPGSSGAPRHGPAPTSEPSSAPPPYRGQYAASGQGAPTTAAPSGQYGPGHPVGESTSGRKAALILAGLGALVVVVAAVILGFAFLGSSGGTDSPEDAVKRFTSAVSDGDCEKATDVLSAKLKEAAPCALFGDSPVGNISVSFDDIAVTSQTDDDATVKAGLSGFGQTFAITFLLIHEGDKWLIDDINAGEGPG